MGLRIVGPPAAVAQLVECVLGKDEVMGSNPISSSLRGVQVARWFGWGLFAGPDFIAGFKSFTSLDFD